MAGWPLDAGGGSPAATKNTSGCGHERQTLRFPGRRRQARLEDDQGGEFQASARTPVRRHPGLRRRQERVHRAAAEQRRRHRREGRAGLRSLQVHRVHRRGHRRARHRQSQPVAAIAIADARRLVQGRRGHLSGARGGPVEHHLHRGSGGRRRHRPAHLGGNRAIHARSLLRAQAEEAGRRRHLQPQPRGSFRRRARRRLRRRREKRKGDDRRAGWLPRCGDFGKRHGRQCDEPARELHVRHVAAAVSDRPGRRRARPDDLARHGHPHCADGRDQTERRNADDRGAWTSNSGWRRTPKCRRRCSFTFLR